MSMIFKGRRLLELSKLPNAHQLALRSRVSYPTIDRYVNKEDITMIDTRILQTILKDGCGMTAEQIANLRLGDLFEVKDAD